VIRKDILIRFFDRHRFKGHKSLQLLAQKAVHRRIVKECKTEKKTKAVVEKLPISMKSVFQVHVEFFKYEHVFIERKKREAKEKDKKEAYNLSLF
jgi:hypothetical protein